MEGKMVLEKKLASVGQPKSEKYPEPIDVQERLLDAAEVIKKRLAPIGIPRQTVYCAAKYTVRGFTEALRTELEDSHIGVTVVPPGGVATRFVTDSRAVDDTRKQEFADMVAKHSLPPEKVAAKIIRGIEKNKPRIFAGPEPYVVDLFRRIAPNTGQRLLGRWLGKMMP